MCSVGACGVLLTACGQKTLSLSEKNFDGKFYVLDTQVGALYRSQDEEVIELVDIDPNDFPICLFPDDFESLMESLMPQLP